MKRLILIIVGSFIGGYLLTIFISNSLTPKGSFSNPLIFFGGFVVAIIAGAILPFIILELKKQKLNLNLPNYSFILLRSKQEWDISLELFGYVSSKTIMGKAPLRDRRLDYNSENCIGVFKEEGHFILFPIKKNQIGIYKDYSKIYFEDLIYLQDEDVINKFQKRFSKS